ncbi:PREDICTED: uncharacterized protein LOC103323432 [Prunus mume]|uniref:Uncharacterized protein LOC103323432 n=1 Tax=Prunus mume TaxID=102107 RepID=A0ABM0NEM6_PRUMU|nr:PREDICTED: uncharacterized protein LOC103323432 [Prunus mume]
MNIDDLPQHLLVEILCRLPRIKIVFQCKCVSKRWSALISNSYFVLCFLSVRKGTTEDTLFFETTKRNKQDKEFVTMSALSSGFRTHKFFLSFVPGFGRLAVCATYNDLILCCPEDGLSRDYYICNPYTKQWVALPPAPRVHRAVAKTGFICDGAYYNCKELDGDRITSTNAGIELNSEYRYRVVNRIRQRGQNPLQFRVEIFSSETGEWTQSVIQCPQDFLNFDDINPVMLAYKGMLYWSANGGILMALDPFNNNPKTTSTSGSTCAYIFENQFCRFTAFDKPAFAPEDTDICLQCLSVCQGRLRMCYSGTGKTRSVWEWKEVQEQSQGGKLMKWFLIKRFSWEQLVTENNPVISIYALRRTRVLALDPKYEDILYVALDGDIVACDFRTRTSFKRRRRRPKNDWSRYDAEAYSFSRPSWPTTVPKPFPRDDDVLVERYTDMNVMLFFSKTDNPINRIYPIWESFIMAALPSGCKSRSLSLSFLPCFDQTRQIESYVLGTYNDLILCCVEDGFARDYSICNPYTKQWIALPPTPRVHLESVLTGFTCDHHYYNREEMMEDRTSTSNKKLEYRYRVVRIPAPVVEHNFLEFTVEIFSSETGEWRESVISSSRGFSFTCHSCTPGVAYNGMVCWLVFGGLLIGVDPFNNINNSISTGANITGDIVVNNELCRFVQFHKPEYNIERVECLGLCRGRLRMCHFDLDDPRRSGIVCVWELKEVEEEDDQQADGIASRLMKWCLIKRVDLKELVAENPQIDECWAEGTIGWCFAKVRAFDTNDEDILYLDLGGDIVTFNLRKRTAFVRGRISPRDTMSFNELTKAFPLSLPRWPTPLPN